MAAAINGKKRNRVFSLTWTASLQIYWNKGKRLHRKRLQLPQIGLGHQHGRRFIVLGQQYGRRTSYENTLYRDVPTEK